MRNSRRKIAAIVGAFLLAALPACAGGGGENSMTLMVDVGYLPKHAPFFAAVERGFFAAEGIDLTIMPGSGSTNTVTSVETGKVDAGWADFGSTIISQGRGAAVKQVNLLQARSAYAVVALGGTGINGWHDLRGKTLATEGAGAMTAMWPYAMSKLGLTEGDVDVVHASSGSKIPGLLAGQWDANLALYVSDEPAIDALGRQAVVLKWSDLGIDLYGNGIVVSDDKLASDPDQVRSFNRAMQKGFLWACDHPEEAAQDFQKEVSGFETETITLAIREQCSLNWGTGESANQFGVMDDAGVEKMLDISRRFLGLPADSDLTPEHIYTNDFLAPLHRGETIQAP
ncbi:ABC transporter substrate-binding protein [Nocardia donostiensis]|uniref:Nitrate ABC transporter substrate-binding protein n=1 Tax=Nocardia donostiensis TaxID=1538463 RepID=A0A1V2TBE1_9NOCA|nr:ABC transporter substrate-binding protein [Nocardia donostiensis]ONM46820.1 nitrate ABC transporter substrate-binding protein [Nocardia donostiensis]OQS16410.1 nitrate ABC transporter substrate-binding protein [Nocardia donostiensis]OQS19668.1 nitrate ABC transporter substrate-binding protein [Nocardia donostiensis]